MQIAPLMSVNKDEKIDGGLPQFALSLLSAASRWSSGGDYMGLAADKDGLFHPFWADARSGTFQIYTASVKVDVPPKEETAKGKAAETSASTPKPAAPAPRIESSLVDKVEFVFDPTRYDAAKKQAEIPVRVRNISTQPIYPPIRLEILGFGFPQYWGEEEMKQVAENAPSALNSANDKAKEGAVFELGGAIAGAEALEPGALSNPFVLRFQLVDPTKTPPLRLKALGMMAAAR
jgi:hypothetical protein